MATSPLALPDAFARLPTSDSRLNALRALINQLTPYEWRFVHSLTNTRTFHCDLIARLPVELVSHIFSHLDTSTPWRLHHVSQSWYRQLRSTAVLKPSLDKWYDATVSLNHVDLDFYWSKARSIHAFRTPSSSALPDSSFKIMAHFSLTNSTLCGDHLVWLAHDRRQVHILNLRTLTSKSIVPMARESLQKVDASDDLVMATTLGGGVVYVGELTGHGPVKRFRFVNSSKDSTVTCRSRTVACTTLQPDGLLIYIWDYDTQQGRSFTVTHNTPVLSGDQTSISVPNNGIGLLLQPDTKTMILCLLVQRQTGPEIFSNSRMLTYYQFSYSGDCLHGARQMLDGQHEDSILDHSDDRITLKFTPASRAGLFMLHCNAWAFGTATKTISMLQYDEKEHSFTTPSHPRLHPTDNREQGHVVWWKDTFVEAGTKDHIVVHRGTGADPRNDSVVAYDPVRRMARNQKDQHVVARELLINDTYIVRPYCDAFYVYCYDHTVQFPGKEGLLQGVGPWKVIEPEFASVRACITAMDQI